MLVNCKFFDDSLTHDTELWKFYESTAKSLHLSFTGQSICVINPNLVDDLLKKWEREMSGILPFYAVKALPDDRIIKKMKYFDCASAQEFKQVISLGADPKNIIYANTAKRPADIVEAKKCGIKLMTLDSIFEADKIMSLYPECGLVLRLAVSDKGAQFTTFAHKFGSTSVENSKKIIDKYFKKIKGFSFHVGCGQTNKNAWSDAMEMVDELFSYVLEKYPMYYDNITFIDIGGGYSTDSNSLPLTTIRCSLDFWKEKYFDKVWIAEPGRFFCADTMTLLCPIISKNMRHGKQYYVIGNSIHHTFSCIIFDLHKPKQLSEEDWGIDVVEGVIVGETCDGVDVLYNGLVGKDLEIGDVLVFEKIGAYSNASANHFNGFEPPKVVYFNRLP